MDVDLLAVAHHPAKRRHWWQCARCICGLRLADCPDWRRIVWHRTRADR